MNTVFKKKKKKKTLRKASLIDLQFVTAAKMRN